MQLQEATAPQQDASAALSTPQSEIEEFVSNHVITEGAGDALLKLQSAEINHSPDDVERHKKMMDEVIKHATSLGKSYVDTSSTDKTPPILQ